MYYFVNFKVPVKQVVNGKVGMYTPADSPMAKKHYLKLMAVGQYKFIVADKSVVGAQDVNFDTALVTDMETLLTTTASQNRLERCIRQQATLMNFSPLVPAIKQPQVGRFDKKIAQLQATLISTPSMFSDIYDYCAQVYLIDAPLVDELLTSSHSELNNQQAVDNYLSLIEKFWRTKANAINELLAPKQVLTEIWAE